MAEPVTLAEARAQVNILDDADTTFDAFLTSLLGPARAYVERATRYSFVSIAREESFPSFGDFLELYRRPLASVDSVEYGADGTGTEYAGFQANLGSYPVRIYAAPNDSFPTLEDGQTVKVSYTTGALDSGSEEYLIGKRAMLLLIGFWFENRGEVPIDKNTQFALDCILDGLRPVSAY